MNMIRAFTYIAAQALGVIPLILWPEITGRRNAMLERLDEIATYQAQTVLLLQDLLDAYTEDDPIDHFGHPPINGIEHRHNN
ncbi:MAG: hypothetical protein K2Q25_02300 [Mycobacteriaceae bacterium]|nr:hypothetical protein [Mycobacteriaceae bacterium]